MYDVMTYPVELAELDLTFDMTCSTEEAVDFDESSAVVIGGDPYTGTYEVTPSRETQVLSTANLYMNENVTIKPIPSNYGLITWDGTKLTVS